MGTLDGFQRLAGDPPKGPKGFPRAANGRFKSPQSTVKQPPGPPGGCPEAAARLAKDPWGPMGGELLRPRGHPRDLGIPGDSQASPGTFRDPWESPSASLDPPEIAIHNSLACGFHHGTYVPLSHWYQRLEASTLERCGSGAGGMWQGRGVRGKPGGRAAVCVT